MWARTSRSSPDEALAKARRSAARRNVHYTNHRSQEFESEAADAPACPSKSMSSRTRPQNLPPEPTAARTAEAESRTHALTSPSWKIPSPGDHVARLQAVALGSDAPSFPQGRRSNCGPTGTGARNPGAGNITTAADEAAAAEKIGDHSRRELGFCNHDERRSLQPLPPGRVNRAVAGRKPTSPPKTKANHGARHAGPRLRH